jgi:hypothetical protein
VPARPPPPPRPALAPPRPRTQLLFIDTEGFESTGKADAYDDRIFALSALLSSVLIYNLPEAVRLDQTEFGK